MLEIDQMSNDDDVDVKAPDDYKFYCSADEIALAFAEHCKTHRAVPAPAWEPALYNDFYKRYKIVAGTKSQEMPYPPFVYTPAEGREIMEDWWVWGVAIRTAIVDTHGIQKLGSMLERAMHTIQHGTERPLQRADVTDIALSLHIGLNNIKLHAHLVHAHLHLLERANVSPSDFHVARMCIERCAKEMNDVAKLFSAHIAHRMEVIKELMQSEYGERSVTEIIDKANDMRENLERALSDEKQCATQLSVAATELRSFVETW